MNSINDRIKEVRLLLKMSQEEFGKAIGLSKSGISNIENGEREIRDIYITTLCTTFNIDVGWLRTGVGEPLLVSSVNSYESFIAYLKSVGYAVQFGTTPDGEDSFVELLKNGETVGYTMDEFRKFQAEINNSVEFQVWKKQKGVD